MSCCGPGARMATSERPEAMENGVVRRVPVSSTVAWLHWAGFHTHSWHASAVKELDAPAALFLPKNS